MTGWVDFKKLRQELDFETVLRAYGVEVKIKQTHGGRQHQGFCPLPTCNEGKGRSPSFSANLDKGIWQCFSCGAKGNAIDFGVRMEGLDPERARDFRQGALRLQDRFLKGEQPVEKKEEDGKRRKLTKPSPSPKQDARIVINAPLDFELKGIEPDHPYLKERGYTKETIAHFGLGFCARGLMKGRIAIELHNMDGKRIGYAGRLVDESAVNEDNPRYLFPPKREKEGVIHEFHKSDFVYNGFQIRGSVDNLVVVESFTSVWWLWQHGFKNAVAVMGSTCSERQAEHIAKLCHEAGRVWLLPDGDEAGMRCAETLLRLISPHRFVRWVRLHQDKQPTDLDEVELKQVLKTGGDYAGR
jgi:DNA primase